MKCLILAAGYATRMYPLTLNKAKPLLPVAGKPVLEHIIERIEKIDEIDEIMIVTNGKFFQQFQDWQRQSAARKLIKIFNDQSLSEDDRLGAIGDMQFVIKARQGNIDDLLVIGGDNLLQLGLREFIDFSKEKIPASSIGLFDIKDKGAVKKYSQVQLGGDNRIVHFVEKPAQPTSTLIAKCIYFFPLQKLGLISEYLRTGSSADAPGHYISWLCLRDTVYGFIFSGKWYDIGNYEIYQKANEEFK